MATDVPMRNALRSEGVGPLNRVQTDLSLPVVGLVNWPDVSAASKTRHSLTTRPAGSIPGLRLGTGCIGTRGEY